MVSNDTILEREGVILKVCEEILTVVKSLVDLLVVDNVKIKGLPTIDYTHEKDIDIEPEKVEDLQEVHDETKEVMGECQECGKELDAKWKTLCKYHYAKMMEAKGE